MRLIGSESNYQSMNKKVPMIYKCNVSIIEIQNIVVSDFLYWSLRVAACFIVVVSAFYFTISEPFCDLREKGELIL